MRLRTLTEAECRTRLYGSRGTDRVSVVRVLSPERPPEGERLRRLFEERLDARGPETEAEAA